MPTYEIEQYELHTSKYRVAANSEGEAVEQSQEFIEVADEYGLPADEFPELARELAKLGVADIDDVISSIRNIEEV